MIRKKKQLQLLVKNLLQINANFGQGHTLHTEKSDAHGHGRDRPPGFWHLSFVPLAYLGSLML